MRRSSIRRLAFLFIIPVFIFFCCFGIYKNTEAESTGHRFDDAASYESVLVCKGDTLWSIAEANLDQPTKAEIQAYVEEIASINKISSGVIHTGNYVLVPIYHVK